MGLLDIQTETVPRSVKAKLGGRRVPPVQVQRSPEQARLTLNKSTGRQKNNRARRTILTVRIVT
jgi:hypothetical protein